MFKTPALAFALLGTSLLTAACSGSPSDPGASRSGERASSTDEVIDVRDGGAVDSGHHHKKDGGEVDGSGGKDAGSTTPRKGELFITEVMFDPSTTEPNTEWFEIFNSASTRLLLSGLVLKDGSGRTHTISSTPELFIRPSEYAVFARSASDCETLALVPATAIKYEYGTGLGSGSGILLANGATGGISLLDATGTTVLASVPYGPWGIGAGGTTSIQLGTLTFPESDSSKWCVSANPWATGSDLGTPGKADDCP